MKGLITMLKSKLYFIRKENKLRQADMAKVLNISEQSYYLKETGKRDFNLTEAIRLAKYYGSTLDELFWEESN